nr:MAG TPA: hypothetical protein [Caudoviricetes sp.]
MIIICVYDYIVYTYLFFDYYVNINHLLIF